MDFKKHFKYHFKNNCNCEKDGKKCFYSLKNFNFSYNFFTKIFSNILRKCFTEQIWILFYFFHNVFTTVEECKKKFEKEEDIIKEIYNSYLYQCELCEKIKKLNKKGRKINFPEMVSEYIVSKITNSIKPKNGDLFLLSNGKKIEVKCYASNGPISFGPTEKWDIIVFVDVINTKFINILVYDIPNNSEKWKNIKVNSRQTYEDQCIEKRRPRISPSSLIKQLPKPLHKLTFDSIEHVFTSQINLIL